MNTTPLSWRGRIHALWAGPLWRRLLIVGIPVIVLLGLLWTTRRAGAVEYYTARVERGSVSQVVQATGTINAVVSVQVGSQVSGTIQKLYVDFNSHVTDGQVIAQIEPSNFKAKVMQATADLQTAQANVKALEANIDIQKGDINLSKANLDKAKAQQFDAKTQADRTEQLAATGVVAPQQLDTSKANYDVAAAGVEAAEAALQQSQAKLQSTIAQRDQASAQVALKRAALEAAQLDLDHATIHAPIDGTVIARNVDVGQTVAASLSAPTLFVIAQDLTKMQVYAKTDEADVGRIRPGAEATFRVDAFPRETFNGRVQQVRMNATTAQNVVTYDTIIEFDNPGQRLFPGMTAYVSIPVAWENDVVKIPNGALRFKPNFSDQQINALYAKYGIPTDNGAVQTASAANPAPAPAPGEIAAGATANVGASANGGAGAAGARGRRGGNGGGGNGGGGRRGASGGTSNRNDWAVVWKKLPDNSLQPVRVRQGVTDFTFTAMEEGNLKIGDELVIGESGSSTTAQTQSTPATPLGGGGGRGGFGGFRGGGRF